MNYRYESFEGALNPRWPPDVVFLHGVAQKGLYCERTADKVLRLAEKPEFFVFEEEDDERRATALHVLGLLVRRAPRDWLDKARPLLEECADDDSPRCQKLAEDVLNGVEWYGSGWYSFLAGILRFF